MRTAKTLVRLGGCPGWTESSLGAHAILLVLSWHGSISNVIHGEIFLDGCCTTCLFKCVQSQWESFGKLIVLNCSESSSKRWEVHWCSGATSVGQGNFKTFQSPFINMLPVQNCFIFLSNINCPYYFFFPMLFFFLSYPPFCPSYFILYSEYNIKLHYSSTNLSDRNSE